MKTSRKLFVAAGSSAALAYVHGFASAYLETVGSKHYADWAFSVSVMLAIATLLLTIVGAGVAVDGEGERR